LGGKFVPSTGGNGITSARKNGSISNPLGGLESVNVERRGVETQNHPGGRIARGRGGILGLEFRKYVISSELLCESIGGIVGKLSTGIGNLEEKRKSQ